MKEFHVDRNLGDGAYSTVIKVVRKADKQPYALKRVNIGQMSEKDRENAINEVRILASIQHPNIVSYKEAFVDTSEANDKTLCIVM